MKRRILAVILTLVVLMGTVCSAAGFEEFGDLGIYGEEDRFPVFEDGTDSSVENPDDSSGGWEEFPGDETLPPQWQEETIPEETLSEEACPVETLPLDEMEEKENESTLPTEQETEPAEMELQPTETVEADEVALTELYKDCMTIEKLTNLDMETAGAATEYLPENPVLFSLSAERPEMWSFDAYYVNQEDSYSVMKTRDFSLKYQFEFHTDTDLEVEAVSLRFPLALLQDRYGEELTPSDIGVPFGTPENFIPISTSPFNYYTEGADLVFFNYRKILSGTNAAVQILYKNIKILDIPDQMQWQLLPQALVTVGENTETLQTQSLTGMVDTKAELAFVKKAAEKEAGKNYTPGLYSMEQLLRYADSVPEKFQTNFSDYAFVLWEASVAGSATQAWELYLKENPAYTYNGSSGTGEIVSIRTCVLDSMGNRKSMHLAMPAEEETYEGYYQASDYFTDFRGREDFRLKCEIVIAYPKEYAIANKTIFTNEVQILLHPADGYDEDILKTSSANWTWANYQWSYKGNTIGVTKTAARENYTGWMDMYRQVVANSGNTGEFPFSVRSESRGYGYTHNVSGTYSQDTYLNGSSYKVITADDVIYAYPLTGSVSGQKLMLSDEDYYFTEISIMQTDQGYDIYEDEPAAPEPVEKTPGINRNLEIYAMYKGGESWELADTVEWDPSGQMKYVFPRELLNRQPWRVKAVHSSVDYKTQCDISLKIRIRPDSPAFQKILTEAGENTVIRLENLGAVSGMYYTGLGSSGVWYHDQSTAGSLYQEENLAPLTQNLYGTIAMRDCRLITLSSVKKRARAQKYASAANNPAQERIEIQYTVSAWEGYEVYSDNMLPDLKKLNLQLPERKQAVFYDLLPFGVQFDPSKEIRAGRITGTSETECRIPSLWDEYRVNVRIDPAADVIQNYRGTGRTLLRIHVSYEGEDPSFFRAGMWGSGFGISFRAYCSWSDMAAAQEVPNVCAYMPENGDYTPILGEAGEAACDDGLLISAVNPEDYSCFGSDINEDGITDIPNILYCRAMAFEDIASAMQSGIVKTVRGEENRFGTFERSADVHLGEAYTYDITVTNVGRQPLKEIVIFDRLEQAAVDRREEEKEFSFQDAWWYGTLQSIDTALLRELDIQPVVYYHASREDAPIPDGTLPAKAVLTAENGWQEASTWEGTLEEVEAIAMDVSRKTDGSEFKLANMETLSFQMTLKAPEIPQNAVYAYNNASFYSVSEGLTETETISQMVVGNSTRVKLEECSTLEIIKEVTGEVPDCGEKEAFLFHVSFSDEDGKKVPYASREYVRYFQAEGQWMRKEGIFATDGQGRLYLQAGEKAVFTEKAGVSGLSVSEEPSPFWDTGITEKITGEIRQLIFQNTYRPVLYLEKKLTGIPKGKGLTEDEFHFQVLCGGEPAAEKEFWYVDQAAVYGTVPNMLAVGETDVNGVVSIHAGEVIALFPGQVGEQYTVTEMPDSYGEGTNWLPVKTSAEGTLTPYGDRVILENSFRWKDLYLKKALTCQETERCQAEFSFQIWELCDSEKNGSGQPEASEKLVTGKNWELLDAQLQPLNPPVTGRIGEDGILSCACAGKNIRIQNLEGKKIYCIREIQIPENYIPINDGIAEITMPVYADSANVEISNEYLLRPLRVSKLVIPGKASEEKPDGTVKNENITRRFTMKLLVKEEGEFLPKTNFPYEVEKNGSILRSEMTDSEGSFEISNAETAVFESLGKTGTEYRVSEIPDAEYPPVYPTEGSFAEGILAKEGSSLTVINGSSDSLIFQKKYTAAKGDVLMENALKTAGFRKSEFLKSGFFIETDAGNGWEQTEIDILCINTVDGSTRTVMTGTEAPLILIGTEIAVIQNLEKGTPFRITEMPEYQHRIFTDTLYTNSYITVSQVIPKENAPFTGIVGTELVGSITNELRSFHIGSRIYKSMLNGSQAIPDGAELVFRIEKWNGAFWQPAGNIRYTVMGGNKSSAFTGEVQVTKEDGLIHIYKTPDGIPSVQFEDEVRIKGKEEANSDAFRIEEVTELSDEAYGHLIGYSSSMLINITNTIPIYDMPSETTDTFVNSNITKSIEIEKRMDTECKQKFTMCLRPLTEVGNDYGQSASYLSYTVFDSDTNAMIREGKTLEDGTFSLLAGEYARFYLPDGSHWTVSEIQPYPYQLDYVESNGSNIEVRTDNTVNISLLREASGLLTREMVMFGVFDTDSGLPIPLTEGDITIPETVMYRGQKIRITGIGERAFEGCGKLTSVTIPSHISLIGQYAFHDCGGLKKVALPENLKEIRSYTFWGCSALTDISIPSGVTEISTYAFASCRSLPNIQIPSNVTKIGEYAFRDCAGLTEMTIPNSVTVLSSGLFYECTSLKRVMLSEGVQMVLAYAFAYCFSLEDITIPDSVSYLSDHVFLSCVNLSRVELSENVATLKEALFEGCISLERIEIPDKVTSIEINAFSECRSLQEIKMPSGLTSLKSSVFFNCVSLEKISVFGTITVLPDRIFLNCINLQSVEIPDTVTKISEHAFFNCHSLISINVLPNLTSLERYCFANTGLTEIQLSSRLNTISNYVFDGCSALKRIFIDKLEGSVSGEKWGAPNECQIIWSGGISAPVLDYDEEDAFFYYKTVYGTRAKLNLIAPKDCDIQTAIIPEEVNGKKVTSIYTSAFAGCTKLEEVRIPDTVTDIYQYAFQGCIRLKNCVLPESIVRINTYAFAGCAELTEFVLPAKVVTLGNGLFIGCEKLTKVTVSEGVPAISARMFRGCIRLKEISIPSSVTSIGEEAFYSCAALEEIVIPDSVKTIGISGFKSCTRLRKITLSANLVKLPGQIFMDCCRLTDVIFRSKTINYIDTEAFMNCRCLENITLPEDMQGGIEESAFEGCIRLKRLVCPPGLKYISTSAFRGCWSLEEVVLSEKITAIRSQTFFDCRSLETIRLPSDLSVMETCAFENCYRLDHVIIPDKVLSIPKGCFQNCIMLRDVTLGERVAEVKDSAFSGCSNLREITIPESVIKLSGDTFYNCNCLTRINIRKPENSISGAPWNATNKALIVQWLNPLEEEGEGANV